MSEFEEFLGKLVKVVYQDGDHVGVTRGDLVRETENFVEIRTLENLVLIRKSAILKLTLPREESS